MLLLDNAAKESRLTTERNAKKAKAKAEKERKKLGCLGRRQGSARELGLWRFDDSQAKFVLFLPLHHLWLGYMPELLMSQSKNTSMVGISGIGTFKVVTKENKLKILPKRNSIFTFAAPAYSTLPRAHDASAPLPIPEPGEHLRTVLDGPHSRIELHGNQFCIRSADRAERKFKAKESIEL
ncbi:hypothetical protein GGX14DRAFT_466325 [Mycena pura]|uniref:Uncharacterized protein n=1 Tax=Mycena pura TaxID=153505 RepID=A0AAD6Y7D4_9AGAR|nr:hypothetical protein GGX14DRAFT_466325 [Mycena pura]